MTSFFNPSTLLETSGTPNKNSHVRFFVDFPNFVHFDSWEFLLGVPGSRKLERARTVCEKSNAVQVNITRCYVNRYFGSLAIRSSLQTKPQTKPYQTSSYPMAEYSCQGASAKQCVSQHKKYFFVSANCWNISAIPWKYFQQIIWVHTFYTQNVIVRVSAILWKYLYQICLQNYI